MAKKYSCVQGISALTDAIRAEASGTLTPEAKEKVISEAMGVIDNSNFVAAAENMDTAIELKEQIEAENAAEEIPAPPEQPEIF